MKAGWLWCAVTRSHKERRLRKGDFSASGNYLFGSHADMIKAVEMPITELKSLRCCSRCGRLRAVKARKGGAK